MEFDLPKLGKPALNFPHFPTRWQTFLFRAAEYVPMDKIAKVLGVTEEVARRAAADLGLPDYNPGQLWLTKGYLTIIRRLWHILPYEQLMELLDMDTQALCVLLREEDFFSIKLGSEKPICEKVQWRPLTAEEQQRTAAIKTLMEAMPETKVQPFDFHYELPEIHFSGKEVFETRMIYLFSGLYQTAFDVDSHVYCSDALLEAYQKIGINGVWTVGSFNALAPNPFAPNVSEGWEKRLENARAFAERLEKYGIKLYLYLNEPRHMPEKFYEAYPHLRGHAPMEDAVCMCTSTPEAQAYLTDSVEHICRNIPSLGGFFTITRSENPSNCYSHSSVPGMSDYPLCTCPRCSKRSIGDVISEVIACYREGADRVSKEIRIFAWSWAWNEGIHEDIIGKLPERVIMLSQSERLVPFTIGGVNGEVHDYSMSIIGPGKEAMKQWSSAKARGLQTCAKVQMNTTWEASTVPALPVYQRIEEHMQKLAQAGVSHLLLNWTLGGYPSRSIAHAAKYFYESAELAESENITRAGAVFSEAFREFPFHLDVLYNGPQNAGPSSMLFDEPTGYAATMTCYAYDDLEAWRAIYPLDTLENQFSRLCDKWAEGLAVLEAEPDCETKRMAWAAYCLFCASRDQIRFYRARNTGNGAEMVSNAQKEEQTARKMLELMQRDASIGFEAANHYYFSQGQLMEKILNCRYMAEKWNCK